jgi:signal transduction histidine kinase
MDVSDHQRQVIELLEQRAAISAVLRAIAKSPHALQPIFDTILDHATRLCRAEHGSLMLFEQNGYRVPARAGLLDQYYSEGESHIYPMLPGGFLPRLIKTKAPIHIADWTADQSYLRRHPAVVAMVEGLGAGTGLFVPMLAENEVLGAIVIIRVGVRPFAEAQINLVTDFAAQAAIALESTRRERRYREMQAILAHANRVATMGQMTASIAHEVKQPLAAASISGTASLNWLAKNSPEIEQAKQCIGDFRKDVDRASRIVERIQQLARKTTAEKQKLEVNETIVEVIELVRNDILENGVTVQTDFADCLPPLQGDRVQFQQVILNLIINSVQAMSRVNDRKRELVVASVLLETEAAVQVEVRDSGTGLSAENIERLFQPFYTTKPDGMGMGLSICREIIEDHGGRLWASANVPCGATFQFTLPASPYNAGSPIR